LTFEFLIRDCDENGVPKVSKCARCGKKIPAEKLNLHMRRCSKKVKEKTNA